MNVVSMISIGCGVAFYAFMIQAFAHRENKPMRIKYALLMLLAIIVNGVLLAIKHSPAQ